MQRIVLVTIVLLAASCHGRGELVQGSYVNDSLHLQIDVHDSYFVEYVGGREVRGSIAAWTNLCTEGNWFPDNESDVVFKGVLLDASGSQSNREQRVTWDSDSTHLLITVAPGKVLALDRR